MRTLLRRTLMTLAIVLTLLYLAGGLDAVRVIQARWRAFTRPPTAAELQRAAARPDTATPLPTALARNANGRPTPFSQPATASTVSLLIGGVLAGALIAMALTGRANS